MRLLKQVKSNIASHLTEVISRLFKLNPNLIVFTSTNNSNYNFNSKYLFEACLKELSGHELLFVINDDVLRKRLNKEVGDYFISTNTLSGIFKASRAKLWISSALETPYLVLPFIKNKNRAVYHIGHGVPLKNIGLAEENISVLKYINRYIRTRMFTHVLSYSDYWQPAMKKAFRNKNIQYINLGQPRNDSLNVHKDEIFRKLKIVYPQIDPSSPLILYAPTWRNYAATNFFPFKNLTADELNNELKKKNTYLLLRQHPFFESNIDSSYLKQSNILTFNSDKFPEVMDCLSIFDKLITDYSSIYLDFLCLDKPIAFVPYDIELYNSHTGFTFNYSDITPGVKLTSKKEFIEFITSSSDTKKELRDNLKLKVNAKKEGNCNENIELIKTLLK